MAISLLIGSMSEYFCPSIATKKSYIKVPHIKIVQCLNIKPVNNEQRRRWLTASSDIVTTWSSFEAPTTRTEQRRWHHPCQEWTLEKPGNWPDIMLEHPTRSTTKNALLFRNRYALSSFVTRSMACWMFQKLSMCQCVRSLFMHCVKRPYTCNI